MNETERLLSCANPKERERLLAEVFMGHREQLRTMLELRMDPRLRVRVDPSDLLQEAFLEAIRRLEEYLSELPMPLYLWLRRLASQKLVDQLRFHLRSKGRDARLELPLQHAAFPAASSVAVADRLIAKGPSPSQQVMGTELQLRVREALEGMEALDREILTLKHLEGLTNAEAAQVLGIQEKAAGKRYLRALRRLRMVLPLEG